MRGLLVIALVGCYRPNDASCVVRCTTTVDCYGGLTCTNSLCGPPDGCATTGDDAQPIIDATIDDALADAIASDAQFFDAALDAGCTPHVSNVTAVADGELDAMNLTTTYGPDPTLEISATSAVVWRFELPSGVQPSAITGLELQVSFASGGAAVCGGCNPMACKSLEGSGSIDLYPIRSDWAETDVSYTNITASTGWQMEGAKGLLDRGVKVGGAFHAVGLDLDITLAPAAVTKALGWVAIDPGGKLALSLLADSTGVGFVSASHEYITSACGSAATSAGQPTLLLNYCN